MYIWCTCRPQNRFLLTESVKQELSGQSGSTANVQLEPRPPVDPYDVSINTDELYIPGGGIARSFYRKWSVLIFVFCHDHAGFVIYHISYHSRYIIYFISSIIVMDLFSLC